MNCHKSINLKYIHNIVYKKNNRCSHNLIMIIVLVQEDEWQTGAFVSVHALVKMLVIKLNNLEMGLVKSKGHRAQRSKV